MTGAFSGTAHTFAHPGDSGRNAHRLLPENRTEMWATTLFMSVELTVVTDVDYIRQKY